MVVRSSNSCFCLYTEEPCLATTPFIRPPLVSPPIVFRPRRENLRVILLFWRPLQCDHLAITTRILWTTLQRGSTYFLISVFHIIEQKTKKKVRQLDYGNYCKELKFRPLLIWRKFVSSRRVTRLPELPWKRQRFTHFFTKHGQPFKLQKVGSAGRLTHLVQSPFCNGRVSLLVGPTFLHKHFTRFSENPRAQWNGTFQLHRPNKTYRKFGYRACKQDTDQRSWGK